MHLQKIEKMNNSINHAPFPRASRDSRNKNDFLQSHLFWLEQCLSLLFNASQSKSSSGKKTNSGHARNPSEKVTPGQLTVYAYAYHRGRDRYRDRLPARRAFSSERIEV